VKITPSGGQTTPGPPDWFTGDAYIDWLQNADEPSSIACVHVRFCPGARTAWHTHPKGQTLYVTDGIGRVCYRGGNAVEIRPGDVVWTEPNEEHWHGATADRFMAHVAVYQADEQGRTATWLEHVTDDEYGHVH
jgi:quercetin dioxygenase-like cupin family protein